VHRTRHHKSSAPSDPSRSARNNPCSPDLTEAPHARAAIVSLVSTATLNNVEPCAYLKDVLERVSNGYPISRLDDLLP
jgi:hypothetical protein